MATPYWQEQNMTYINHTDLPDFIRDVFYIIYLENYILYNNNLKKSTYKWIEIQICE